ncbi:hypothetical protein NE237_024832 [Protea cynaroides]|uniref:RING-type E3 ubiquitin transferase n=1 Tax=Protea cynaroides TaxID=273540 RepID=A0A9Q0JZK5_9MAGN|nr:hypothetical protein NE237_024832 [Protea cynaroides]
MSSNFHHESPPPSHPPYAAPPVILTLTVVILIFFFASILSIYICRCLMVYLINSSNFGRPPTSNAVQPTESVTNGLDPSIIATFPKFMYSSVKDHRRGKCDLECAVCLAEFEDNDELRLLTVCNHVFHPECIDLWFGNHTTCPLCRRSLLPPEKSPENNVVDPPENDQQENHTREENNSLITENEREMNEEEEVEVEVVVVVGGGGESHEGATNSKIATRDGEQHEEEKVHKRFRWHSTGHSIINVELDPNDDRYILKLPDHIKEHIVRGHNWTGSCTVFGDFSNKAGHRKSGLAEPSGFSGGVTKV